MNALKIGEAVREALDICRLYGLDHHTHVIPRRDKVGKITGYYVLNEDKETAVATVEI